MDLRGKTTSPTKCDRFKRTLENGFVNQDINQHTYLVLSLICLSFIHARLSNTLLIVSFYSVPQVAGGPVPQPVDGGQESRHSPEM